jgi:GNAT superfamily N-acetyltransferase
MPTSGHLHAPRKLQPSDDRSAFRSGVPELDEWFQRYALQNQRKDNAVTYVAAVDGRIVGYYALCAAGVSREEAPAEFARGRPTSIPCVLLARLAVDERAQGRGLGAALFRDAIARTMRTAETLGISCLLVHARDESARSFYLHLADLVESPIDPLQLMLPLAVARRLR